MFWRSLIIIFLSIIYTLLPGCDKCGPFPEVRVQYTGVEIKSAQNHSLLSDSVNWSDTHTILLKLNTASWVKQERSPRSSSGGSLYACSPGVSYELKSTVDSLWLSAEDGFGNDIKAGQDITHLFEAEFNNANTHQSLPFYISWAVRDNRSDPNETIRFRMRSRNLNSGSIRFRAHLKTMDGLRFQSNVFSVIF